MAAEEKSSRKVRFVFRRTRMLTKVVVLVALVLSMVALIALQAVQRNAEREIAGLRDQALGLEQENSQLEQEIAQLGTVQSIIRIAAEKLGLVDPDTVIIEADKNNEQENGGK